MTITADTPRPRAPWHLWAVGIVSLLWNSFGAYDYFMSKTAGDAYFRQSGMTDAQIAYFHAMPAWMTAVWAVGVWGAFAGSVLLLLRMRLAYPVFAASLAGFLMSLVYSYIIAKAPASSQMMVMNLVILTGCLAFLAYAQLMAKRGVLG